MRTYLDEALLRMQSFVSDGVEIAFIDEGPRGGDPVLLIHGFASNVKTNWIDPGWVPTLTLEDILRETIAEAAAEQVAQPASTSLLSP